MFEVLDVGCGIRPRGDVNLDRFMNETTIHISRPKPMFINGKTMRNPVKADAQYLPFRPRVFDEVFSDNVVEHLDNPSQAVEEMIRVSKRKVTFIVPHRSQWHTRKRVKQPDPRQIHKRTFGYSMVKKWLKQLIDSPSFNVKVTIDYKELVTLASLIVLPIRSPYTIVVEIQRA